ncbi:MAG: NUDIX hydrolase [bacterium]|nr:NUDIX hydrolase [bacterium]
MFTKKIAGCIIIENNQILLLKKKTKSWWEIPGGTMLAEETPEETAIREMKEELLCDIELLSLYQENEFIHKGNTAYATWFIAKIKNEQRPRMGEPEEFSDMKFFNLEDLDSIYLSPNVQKMLLSMELQE